MHRSSYIQAKQYTHAECDSDWNIPGLKGAKDEEEIVKVIIQNKLYSKWLCTFSAGLTRAEALIDPVHFTKCEQQKTVNSYLSKLHYSILCS